MIALALTALLACHDGNRLVDPAGDEVSASAAQAGLRLTYMCGNRFRVRTTRTDTVRVRWDVYQKNDTGSVVVPGIESPAIQRDVFFETSAKGTTRIFLGTQLVDTKANGNTLCSPSIREGLSIPNDSAFLAVDSSLATPVVYFRRIATVELVETLTDAQVNAFLAQYQAQVLSGLPAQRVYVVQLPDLGPSFLAMLQRIDTILADPRVILIEPASRVGAFVTPAGWRFPDDAQRERTGGPEYIGTAGVPRESWYGGLNSYNWSMRTVGANAAWGCENGLYGSAAFLPGVAIVESVQPQDADLQASNALGGVVRVRDSIPGSDSISLANPLLNLHARGVAGLITAEGDNGAGIAGVMWRTKLYSAPLFTPTGRVVLPQAFHRTVVPELVRNGVRVINISTHVESPFEYLRPEIQLRAWRSTLTRHPNTLFVLAAGQGDFNQEFLTLPPMSALSSKVKNPTSGVGNVLYHFTRLKKEGFRNLVIVGGARPTFSAGRVTPVRYESGHWVSTSTGGGMDVVAPAQDVLTISGVPGNQSIDLSAGTSFAAPLVSGAAAAALAIDPSLTAVQLRDLIVESSRDSVVDDVTGAKLAKAAVYDGVYMLNVFNLLRRVADRSSTLPICGQPVVTDALQSIFRIVRPGGVLELPYPAGLPSNALAVAPGGRRIASAYAPTFDSDVRSFEYVHATGGWTRGPDRVGINEIHYVDGDTLLFRTNTQNSFQSSAWSVQRRGRVNSTTPILDELRTRWASLVVSPDPTGRFIFARARWEDFTLECSGGGAGSVQSILTLGTSRVQPLRVTTWSAGCQTGPVTEAGEAGGFAWAPNGESGWQFDSETFYAPTATPRKTLVRRWARDSTGWSPRESSPTLFGSLIESARTSLDGGTISTFEFRDPGVCQLTRVAFADPSQQISVASASDCSRRLEQLRVVNGASPLAPSFNLRRVPATKTP